MPASNPRIDELRKKFDENPRRYFAPLANEYRKAGDVDKAIEICRQHLQEQPSHMSGHIVFGQALFEARQYDEGRTVFEAALQLDPENLIALRHLGDIEREAGNPSKARAWYQRVLDADPRNEEIQAQMASLPAEEGTPAAVETQPDSSTDADLLGVIDLDEPAVPPIMDERPGDTTLVMEPPQVPSRPEPAADAVEERSRGGEHEVSPQEPEPLDLGETIAFQPESEVEPAVPAAEGFSPTHFDQDDSSDASPLAGLASAFEDPHAPPRDETGGFDPNATMQVEPMEFEAPQEAPEDAEHRASVDNMMAWGTPTSVTPISNTPVSAGAADPLLDDSFAEFTPPLGVPVTRMDDPPAASVPEAQEEAREEAQPVEVDDSAWSTAQQQPADEATDVDDSHRASGAFVTETMAELYVKQGLIEHAVDVYRQLLAQNPSDTRLQSRLAQLEGHSAPESADEHQPPPVVSNVETPAPRGPSMREILVRIAAARPGQPHVQVQPVESPQAVVTQADDSDWFDTPPDSPSEVPEIEGSSIPVSAPEMAAPAPLPPAQNEESTLAPAGSSEPAASPRGIDALFGGRGVRVEEEAAAVALSGAFSNGEAASVSGRPTRRASDEFSLDRVFSDAPRRTSKGQNFSFNQFFSEGGSSQQAAAEPANEPGDADIAQFNSWLEGLKKK